MPLIRWGLIGCGDVARKRVAAAIQNEPRSELMAACRRDPVELASFCDTFKIERSYRTAEDLMADPDIDAVYIATPVREHLPQTLAAAATGKHVLVEKPMALSVDECDQMIAACRAAGVKLGVAYYRRFYPLVQRVQELLQQQAIGTPLCVSAVTTTPLTASAGESDAWRVVASESGGGALMDIGSHRIDLFRHLFGEINQVKAICQRVAAEYETEDTALLLLQFESGLTGTLQCHFGSNSGADEFAIIGTRGRLATACLNGAEIAIQTDESQRVEQHPPPDNLCGPLIADFVTAIVKDGVARTSGPDGRETNLVMEKAYRDAL